MIADAVDVAFTVLAAAVLWVALAGGVAAGLVVGVCAWLAVRLRASRAAQAPRAHPAPERPSAARLAPWAYTQPLTYEEVA
ncbi:MAG: hypothetical protein HOV82_10125 [Streptomyces sp.]|nr:hypothetical protein [Streptomyces sp.]